MENNYDIAILGGGPIAASTAYFLAELGVKNVVLITEDQNKEHNQSAYLNSGGSIRWFWDDPIKVKATKETADFLLNLHSQNVDLSLIEDNYLFLNKGKFVPSINISGEKLVKWFLAKAEEKGLKIFQEERIKEVADQDDWVVVKTDSKEFKARKVLLAMGTANTNFISDYDLEIEKRQLFVLDIPVTKTEEKFPHTIIPIKNGVAYVFIKKINDLFKFVVGQEDVIEHNKDSEPESYFEDLLKEGLAERLPFLAKAKVEKILWGFDAATKSLNLEKRKNIFIANSGSAIRSSVWIGRTIAEAIQSK